MALFGAIFVTLFLIVFLCVGFGRAFLVSKQKVQIRTMLKRADSVAGNRRPDLLKAEIQQDSLTKALNEWPAFARIVQLLEQSGSEWTITQFMFFTAAGLLAGAFIAFFLPPFSRTPICLVIISPIAATIPLLLTLRKRRKRLDKFEEQFPEALNFLARSMRAGHAFSIGLEMLVADTPDPLGSVFRQMLNDLHLGSNFVTALANLVASVPLIDVRFFVSAVILQQGTGGNLSEILDTMANIIRERFRLKGQVKAASAHGRVTGLILSIMPVVVAAMLFVASPDYLMVLFRDPIGKKLVVAAICGQVIGFFCIRKIVNIKV